MLKNTFLTSLLLLVIISSGFSQFEFGLKGGYTKSWPGYGDLDLPSDAQTDVNGYNLSFFFEIPISNEFSIGLSPGYVRRGAACFPGWQPVFEGDSRVYLNYYDFPVILSRKINLKSFSFITKVGYGFNMLSSASVHQDFSVREDVRTNISRIKVGTDDEDSFRKYDNGLHLGIRVNCDLFENHFLFIEAMYYHGMIDYDKNNVSKNRSLNLNFGFGYKV